MCALDIDVFRHRSRLLVYPNPRERNEADPPRGTYVKSKFLVWQGKVCSEVGLALSKPVEFGSGGAQD